MEVHHHAHTPRKKWTHHIWEFLMLFLAVFCGFLAEYQLEHKIEKERGKLYLRSFYEDLKRDTAEYALVINEYDMRIKRLATRKECYQKLKHENNNECLLDLINLSRGYTDLITSDQTLQQLKNSGNFRLLRQADTDSILLYDKMVRTFLKEETTGFQENIYNARMVIYSLLDYEHTTRGKEDTKATALVSDNKELLNKFFNLLDDNVWRRERFLKLLILLNQKAISILTYFKNEYDLN